MKGVANRPSLEQKVANLDEQLAAQKAAPPPGDPKHDKRAAKALRKQENQVAEARENLDALVRSLEAVDQDAELSELARKHADIERAVLEETAALHAGDATNVQLWRRFLERVKAHIRSPREIKECLADAGGAHTFADIKCSRRRLLDAVLHMHEIRKRPTVVDLSWLLGILPGAAEPIIDQWLTPDA